MVPNGDCGTRRRSTMKTAPFRIKKDGRADVYFHVTVAERIVQANAFADPLRAPLQEPEPDPVPEHRRERHGGHVTLIVLQRGGVAARQEMRTGPQPRALVGWPDADERGPRWVSQAGAAGKNAADEVLLLCHHAPEAEVSRSGRAVEFIAGDMSFLDAHDPKRFGSVGRDVERSP